MNENAGEPLDSNKPIPRVIGVAEFTRGMVRWFSQREGLQNIRIAGEVSDVRTFGAGHTGFTLKEGNATVDCVAYADRRRTLQSFEHGRSVVATGAVKIREDRSGYQLIVESVELFGIGALHAKYEALREKFRTEGLFSPDRKRRIPRFPLRLAFVSAEKGKGAEDFVRAIERDAPYIEILRIESRLQGPGAEIDIAEALDKASRMDVELVVLARGGGTYEHLFPFNLEPVVRAIVRNSHPVVTAIGHQPDIHLADAVADMDFPTPSLAASAIIAGWVSGLSKIRELDRVLSRSFRTAILQKSQRADALFAQLRASAQTKVRMQQVRAVALTRRLDAASPMARSGVDRERFAAITARLFAWRVPAIARLEGGLALRNERLAGAGRQASGRFKQRYTRSAVALDAANPRSPLERGYSILSVEGKTIRDVRLVKPGVEVSARLWRGTLVARVERIVDNE